MTPRVSCVVKDTQLEKLLPRGLPTRRLAFRVSPPTVHLSRLHFRLRAHKPRARARHVTCPSASTIAIDQNKLQTFLYLLEFRISNTPRYRRTQCTIAVGGDCNLSRARYLSLHQHHRLSRLPPPPVPRPGLAGPPGGRRRLRRRRKKLPVWPAARRGSRRRLPLPLRHKYYALLINHT